MEMINHYADYLCILAPSMRGLQKLLDICSAYCLDWDICLNPKKTRNMFFGKSIKTTYTLLMVLQFHGPTSGNILAAQSRIG